MRLVDNGQNLSMEQELNEISHAATVNQVLVNRLQGKFPRSILLRLCAVNEGKSNGTEKMCEARLVSICF